MDLPDWVEQLWSKLRFMERVGEEHGEGFQRLFQQVMKAVDGDDFIDVRPIGSHGDFKCDGWGVQENTCYAVYGPFTRKKPSQVRTKLASDFYKAVECWPEMLKWRPVHNDIAGLGAVVTKGIISLREEARTNAPGITVLPPWGPKDLWWLLQQAPAKVRAFVLGTHGWQLNQGHLQDFAGISDDPVSLAAGRSVAQLLDNFATGGIVDPLAATAFSGALTTFLIGDEAAFENRSGLLKQCCGDNPFETMLTSIVFCIKAIQLWENTTGGNEQLWARMLHHSGFTIPYITDLVLSARHGTELDETVPGHPEDQQKVTMNLGEVTAATLELASNHRAGPLVTVLQDLLISIQREPPIPL